MSIHHKSLIASFVAILLMIGFFAATVEFPTQMAMIFFVFGFVAVFGYIAFIVGTFAYFGAKQYFESRTK